MEILHFGLPQVVRLLQTSIRCTWDLIGQVPPGADDPVLTPAVCWFWETLTFIDPPGDRPFDELAVTYKQMVTDYVASALDDRVDEIPRAVAFFTRLFENAQLANLLSSSE